MTACSRLISSTNLYSVHDDFDLDLATTWLSVSEYITLVAASMDSGLTTPRQRVALRNTGVVGWICMLPFLRIQPGYLGVFLRKFSICDWWIGGWLYRGYRWEYTRGCLLVRWVIGVLRWLPVGRHGRLVKRWPGIKLVDLVNVSDWNTSTAALLGGICWFIQWPHSACIVGGE